MKLEDQVITKYQSKKLKELGINAEALWYWVYPINDQVISSQYGVCHKDWAMQIIQENEGDWTDLEMASAYSVSELGVLLPSGYDTMHCSEKGWRGYDHDGNDFQIETFRTEAECRAEMLIHLLQRNIVTAEECNKRLTDK